MATIAKRASDGKIIIECDEKELEILYQGMKALTYRYYFQPDRTVEYQQANYLRQLLVPLRAN